MTRSGVTFDEVAIAASEITQTGQRPTIERIRAFLGSTGSNSTISKHLQVWRNQVSDKQTAPDKTSSSQVVHAVVESVWQQIREQTDAEIEKIKEETQQQIEQAKKEAREAQAEKQKQHQEYLALQEAFHSTCSEKEILILDLRKLREEQALLQEQYRGLDDRYSDMQTMAAAQLKITTDAHQKEVQRLEQTIAELKSMHQAMVDEIKAQSEQERHRQMLILDNLKINNQKKEKLIDSLQEQIQNARVETTELNSRLTCITQERDQSMACLSDHEKKWQLFNDKILVSDDIARKLHMLPALDKTVSYLNQNLTGMINLRFSQLNEEIKQLVKQMDVQNESIKRINDR